MIFSYFWDSYFLSYGEFVELINMHAMKLRVQALPAELVGDARIALPLVGGRHNNVGVSLREMRATMQVMLEVSLRARWDATLVKITNTNN